MNQADDLRFRVPLYTIAEAARDLGVPAATLATWAKGYERRFPGRARPVKQPPVITAFEADPRQPTIPFVGLAEGMVIAAFRRAGVSMQHIRKAVAVLEREIGLDHALASRALYTDGARILCDYAGREGTDEFRHLVEVISGQGVFSGVIADYLKRITYGADGWATRLVVPITSRQIVEVDPTRAVGQPIFVHGAARVEDVLARFKAGEPLNHVAADFGVPFEDVEDVVRAVLPLAA